MMKTQIKDLIYFVRIMEHGNITEAAEHLKSSQSSLTKFIQKLEYSLGNKLVDHGSTNSALTSYGKLVFQRFYPYKQRLENNLINAFAAEGEFDSKIYLALPLLVYNAILPLLAEDLLKKYPLIRLNVTCLNKPNLTLDEVGKFDLCFSEKISAANKFSLNRIGEFYSQLYCGEKYAQEFGVPQSLAELEKDHAKHLAVLTKRRLGFTRFSDGELFLCDVTPRIIAPMNFLSYIQDSNLLVESHYHGVAKQDSRIIKVLPDYYLLHGEFYLIKNLQRRTKVVDLVESKILEYIASEMSKYTGDFL